MIYNVPGLFVGIQTRIEMKEIKRVSTLVH